MIFIAVDEPVDEELARIEPGQAPFVSAVNFITEINVSQFMCLFSKVWILTAKRSPGL